MESNICKLNLNRSSDLICRNFVLETGAAHAVPVQYEYYLLGIVINGEGVLQQGEHTHTLEMGRLFLVMRDQPFSICSDGSLQYCYITFLGRRADELVERVDINMNACVLQSEEALDAFWLNALHRANEGNIDLLAEAVLLYSMAQLKPDQRPQNDLVTKMLILTNDRFTEPGFSLVVLGEELGYGAKYLSSLFKKKKGIAFTQYLRDLRVRHAVFLIEQGVVSVKNIAILSGFDDALYFSKIFKQYVGSSPKNYIESLQSSKTP